MDPFDLLTEDHEHVKKLLAKGQKADAPAERERLLREIKQELTVHETIEEEIFYPALREHPKARELVLEAYEEHNVVDRIMADLEKTPAGDETWAAKFTVMTENIEHHVEEEETELFKKARQALKKSELDELGARMQERKERELAKLEKSA